MIKPFKINISDKILDEIYGKVKKYPWHEMLGGGHFTALEKPDLLIDDIQKFAQVFRSTK